MRFICRLTPAQGMTVSLFPRRSSSPSSLELEFPLEPCGVAQGGRGPVQQVLKSGWCESVCARVGLLASPSRLEMHSRPRGRVWPLQLQLPLH